MAKKRNVRYSQSTKMVSSTFRYKQRIQKDGGSMGNVSRVVTIVYLVKVDYHVSRGGVNKWRCLTFKI